MIDDVLMHLRRILRNGRKFEPSGMEDRKLKVSLTRADIYLKGAGLCAGDIMRKDAGEIIKDLEARNQALTHLLVVAEAYLKEHSEYNFLQLKGITALARKEMK